MKNAYVKPIMHDGSERVDVMIGTKPLANAVIHYGMARAAATPLSRAGNNFFMECLPTLEAVSS